MFPDHPGLTDSSAQYLGIASLGEARIASPLGDAAGEERISMPIDADVLQGLHVPQTFSFELAGPRPVMYFDPSKLKAAVVSCGGLCPGINDVIRSLARTLHESYGVASVLGIRYGLRGFIPRYGLNVVQLTPEAVSAIHESGGSILGTSRGPQPTEDIVDALERLGVSILFVIGGDGTMKAAAAIETELRRRDQHIAVVGIPKTIDNDIPFIPRSFGFETAVAKATEAIRCARIEAMSVSGGIGIVKVMGRESGFIAAHATLGVRDVSFALVPELPFSLHGDKGLLARLTQTLEQKGHALLVVAEGAGQDLLEGEEERDASGNLLQQDICAWLMQRIAAHCKKHSISYYFKYIDPSYTIRSVPADAGDRIYCALLGQHAAHAGMSGKTGMVVAKIMDKFVHLPLELVTRGRRKMNPHSDLWRAVLAATGQGSLGAGALENPPLTIAQKERLQA